MRITKTALYSSKPDIKIHLYGFMSFTKEDMVKLACAYWHEHYVSDVNRVLTLDTEELRVAGYLTELFSTFNCLEEQDALRHCQCRK